VPISVNVFPRHLSYPSFIDDLRDTIARCWPEMPAKRLLLEIVETSELEELDAIEGVIKECLSLGIGFSLDDFGTGYSSLTYLKRLPVATIKIDRSFVGEILSDPNNLVIVQGVIGLTSAFQRRVIAEGVETAEHGRLLLQLDCDHAQGFGIARPMPGDQVVSWIRTWRPDPQWQEIAGLRWDRADYPMLIAEVEQRNWVSQLVYSIKEGQPVPHCHVGDPRFCRFGRWYDGPDAARYQAIPAFLQIAAEHQRLHEIAEEIDGHMRNGRPDSARVAISRLLDQESKVVVLLKDLQMQVAKPR
jgi:hypothetical protein